MSTTCIADPTGPGGRRDNHDGSWTGTGFASRDNLRCVYEVRRRRRVQLKRANLPRGCVTLTEAMAVADTGPTRTASGTMRGDNATGTTSWPGAQSRPAADEWSTSSGPYFSRVLRSPFTRPCEVFSGPSPGLQAQCALARTCRSRQYCCAFPKHFSGISEEAPSRFRDPCEPFRLGASQQAIAYLTLCRERHHRKPLMRQQVVR